MARGCGHVEAGERDRHHGECARREHSEPYPSRCGLRHVVRVRRHEGSPAEQERCPRKARECFVDPRRRRRLRCTVATRCNRALARMRAAEERRWAALGLPGVRKYNPAGSRPPMTYCVAIQVNDGLVFASDTRTSAGVDDVRTYSKMHVFEFPGERSLVVLSAGNLATTHAILAQTRRDLENPGAPLSLRTARCMYDAAEYLDGVSTRADGHRRAGPVRGRRPARDAHPGRADPRRATRALSDLPR